MLWWLSSALKPSLETCLRSQAGRAQSHDVLFHTVLSLLQVRSTVYQTDYDLLAGCVGQGKSIGMNTEAQPSRRDSPAPSME